MDRRQRSQVYRPLYVAAAKLICQPDAKMRSVMAKRRDRRSDWLADEAKLERTDTAALGVPLEPCIGRPTSDSAWPAPLPEHLRELPPLLDAFARAEHYQDVMAAQRVGTPSPQVNSAHFRPGRSSGSVGSHGVGVEFDPATIEEPDEASVIVQHIPDCLRRQRWQDRIGRLVREPAGDMPRSTRVPASPPRDTNHASQHTATCITSLVLAGPRHLGHEEVLSTVT